MTEDTQTLVPAVKLDAQKAVDLLTGLVELEMTDTSELNAAQVRRILLAESEDEAFGEIETRNSEDMVDTPFEVADLALLPSQYNGGKGAFVAAECTDLGSGEQFILTTSAARVAARLVWLKLHEKLPRQVLVTVVSESTARGRKVYGLELVG